MTFTFLNLAFTEERPCYPQHPIGVRPMSVCYRLVLDSVCRSNHHRLAVLALEHMQGEQSAKWRDAFLKHRDAYRQGAKAPDEVFKDFKNHVLHVRDGDWGGAPQAAREWYSRTVRALRAETGLAYDQQERGILEFYTTAGELDEGARTALALQTHNISALACSTTLKWSALAWQLFHSVLTAQR